MDIQTKVKLDIIKGFIALGIDVIAYISFGIFALYILKDQRMVQSRLTEVERRLNIRTEQVVEDFDSGDTGSW